MSEQTKQHDGDRVKRAKDFYDNAGFTKGERWLFPLMAMFAQQELAAALNRPAPDGDMLERAKIFAEDCDLYNDPVEAMADFALSEIKRVVATRDTLPVQ